MGNLFSVNQACVNVGLKPTITSDREIINNADALILPGVGSFGEAMKNLHELDIVETIKENIASSKPFLGICLGFQLLFSESEEFGNTKGLDIFKGRVKKFNYKNKGYSKTKIPQIGWNNILPYDNKKWNNSFLSGIRFSEYMYFIHSFFVECNELNIILTTTEYEGFEYCSSIESKNLFASQFHPEKSAVEGLKIYYNFAKIINVRD